MQWFALQTTPLRSARCSQAVGGVDAECRNLARLLAIDPRCDAHDVGLEAGWLLLQADLDFQRKGIFQRRLKQKHRVRVNTASRELSVHALAHSLPAFSRPHTFLPSASFDSPLWETRLGLGGYSASGEHSGPSSETSYTMGISRV